jgi:hypothetical protein
MSRTADSARRSARTTTSRPDDEEAGFGPETRPDELRPGRRRRSSFEEQTDWQRIGIFGAGMAVGLAIGAGAALLLAPQSGEITRELIGEQARSVGGRVVDRWDDLRDELRAAARRSRKRVRRGVTRGRWAAEDALDRGRRR